MTIADRHFRIYMDEGASYATALEVTNDIRKLEQELADLRAKILAIVGTGEHPADIIDKIRALVADAERKGTP